MNTPNMQILSTKDNICNPKYQQKGMEKTPVRPKN